MQQENGRMPESLQENGLNYADLKKGENRMSSEKAEGKKMLCVLHYSFCVLYRRLGEAKEKKLELFLQLMTPRFQHSFRNNGQRS